MFAVLRTLLTKWFQSPPKAIEAAAPEQKLSISEFMLAHHDDDDQSSQLVPYDENLLERARTQWQFGDWQSLAKIERNTLQHHPDRAKLALLAAAGRLQTRQDAEAEAYISLAQDWGVSKKLISQILIAGVHNSIGRAAAISNQQHRALQHFEDAIQIGTPGSDAKLLTQARSGYQLSALGIETFGNGQLSFARLKSPSQFAHAGKPQQTQAFAEHSEKNARVMLLAELLSRQKFRRIFLDCGGHDGCSTIKFLLLYPDTDVVSFEPNPALWDYYTNLPTYLSKLAVSVDDGVATFIIDSVDADGSSLLLNKQIDITGSRSNHELPSLEVPTINLSELIRSLRQHYDEIILKLDVEGMEYPILELMRTDETLLMLDELYCEFHWMKIGYTEQRHTELVDALRQIVDLHEWDALEFSIHGRKSGTLKRIRTTLVQSVAAKRSQLKGEVIGEQ